jgi:hypothetical protein
VREATTYVHQEDASVELREYLSAYDAMTRVGAELALQRDFHDDANGFNIVSLIDADDDATPPASGDTDPTSTARWLTYRGALRKNVDANAQELLTAFDKETFTGARLALRLEFAAIAQSIAVDIDANIKSFICRIEDDFEYQIKQLESQFRVNTQYQIQQLESRLESRIGEHTRTDHIDGKIEELGRRIDRLEDKIEDLPDWNSLDDLERKIDTFDCQDRLMDVENQTENAAAGVQEIQDQMQKIADLLMRKR